MCYDRLKDGLEPACAKACPTASIQFGAAGRAARAGRRPVSSELQAAGDAEARLYGADPGDGVGGVRRLLPAARRPRGVRVAARPCGAHPRPAAIWRAAGAAAAGSLGATAWRRIGGRPPVSAGCGETVDGPARRAALLLRPAGDQVARMEARGPLVLLHGRAHGRVVHASRSRRDGPATTCSRGAAGALRWLRARPARCFLISDLGRPARFLEHAPHVQGHLPDERRLVGAGGLGVGERLAARAGPGPVDRGSARSHGCRRAPAARRWRHTPPFCRQHLGTGLARGATRASLRVRGQRGRERRRGGGIATPAAAAGPARRLALLGVRRSSRPRCMSMERRLGELAEPYRRGRPAARYAKLARRCSTSAGAAWSRARDAALAPAAVGGQRVVLGGLLSRRWAVFKAGMPRPRSIPATRSARSARAWRSAMATLAT